MGEFIKRECSLMRQVRIERADLSVWQELSCFHYRQHAPGLVDKVFAVRLANRHGSLCWSGDAGGRTPAVGVIVYGMPLANVSLRNLATDNRYVGWGDRGGALRLLNREVRCVNRVVIRPEFRGIGLGRYLVAETLPLAGTVLVESLAVMGRVNPFFEQAGMSRYDGPLSMQSVRMISALEEMGIEQGQLADPVGLRAVIEKLGQVKQLWLIGEMRKYCQTYLNDREVKGDDELGRYVEIVSGHVLSRPVYYLWRRPDDSTIERVKT